MKEGYYNAVKVTDHVYWVGAIDWDIRDFHGYSTNRGTTYNAFLVLAEKPILIDTVKAPFKEEMLARIASLINPKDISYIISNHSEMDHTGCLPQVMHVIKPDKVFASVMGVKALSRHFYWMDTDITPVKDGETMSLGNMNLMFMETRMLHWPDSMVTYLAEDKLLFSQDGFGMHLASSKRFADEIEDYILEYEATKYFANILLPFSPLVLKLLEKIGKLDIPIDIIAPDHGPIWRKDITRILGFYSRFAQQKPGKKAVVVYDTMWQSTALMARVINEGLIAGGLTTKVMPLSSHNRSDIVTEIVDAGALVAGSPTINNGMFPTMADFLTYLKGLKPQNLLGAAFGSYGWSGEAVPEIQMLLEKMKVDIAAAAIKAYYVPDTEDRKKCYELGVHVAEKLFKKVPALTAI